MSNLFLRALQGAQNYSFVIGNKNFTIDWMAPAALTLFIGCEVFNAFGKGYIICGKVKSIALGPVTAIFVQLDRFLADDGAPVIDHDKGLHFRERAITVRIPHIVAEEIVGDGITV